MREGGSYVKEKKEKGSESCAVRSINNVVVLQSYRNSDLIRIVLVGVKSRLN